MACVSAWWLQPSPVGLMYMNGMLLGLSPSSGMLACAMQAVVLHCTCRSSSYAGSMYICSPAVSVIHAASMGASRRGGLSSWLLAGDA
jgi:hypothetical protein